MKHTVLLVDDDPGITDALKRTLRREPYRILSAQSGDEALQILAREAVDLVISDEMMPGMSGSEFLAQVRQKHPDTFRMILTGQATLDAAIRAINQGEIYRFLTKPCSEGELAVTIRQALQQKDLISESRRLLQTVKQQTTLLQDLEKEYPGLTQVKTDAGGAVIIEDPGGDVEALLEEIETEIKRSENLFRSE